MTHFSRSLIGSLVGEIFESSIFSWYTVSPVILIRHMFHMQPTSAGPGTRAHDTHGIQNRHNIFSFRHN
jgi:hypothetical protein